MHPRASHGNLFSWAATSNHEPPLIAHDRRHKLWQQPSQVDEWRRRENPDPAPAHLQSYAGKAPSFRSRQSYSSAAVLVALQRRIAYTLIEARLKRLRW